ncbi:MAG TPA: LysM peptidoglycan-binding domain-containing protein [Clostridia bacterium]|nr:LysM peptidoglycan-binding domain-containing protein [Clostridia bacterium]
MEFYTVKPDDTLDAIGLAFDISPQAIVDVNGLNPEEPLVVGMNLVIPTQSPTEEVTYTVQQGDTLFSIAQQFGVTVYSIIALNDLTFPFELAIGQTLIIQPAGGSTPVLTIETFGYYLPISDPDAFLIRALGRYLTYVGIFDFPVTETGEITGSISPIVLDAAREESVLPVPVLTNLKEGEFDSDLGRAVIATPEILNTFIENIMAFLELYDLPGVMIDFENLHPEDRDLFTNFIRLLFERLHSQDKLLGVNIAAKWEDLPDRPWAGFFDYRALAPYMDLAAIMTYEWGWRGGPPSPTAPLPFVRKVLDYAIASDIPPDRILMGLTNYGYDWPLPYGPANPASTVTLAGVWNLGRTYDAPIIFHDDVKQPSMDYINASGIQHIAWFEDALSHYNKYLLVPEYGLRGVFYWTLNLPLTATWYILSKMFNIRKI